MCITTQIDPARRDLMLKLAHMNHCQALAASLLTVEYIHGWRLLLHDCKWPLVLWSQLRVETLGRVRDHAHVPLHSVTDIILDVSFTSMYSNSCSSPAHSTFFAIISRNTSNLLIRSSQTSGLPLSTSPVPSIFRRRLFTGLGWFSCEMSILCVL